jgi:hypothetical protein
MNYSDYYPEPQLEDEPTEDEIFNQESNDADDRNDWDRENKTAHPLNKIKAEKENNLTL